VLECSSVGERVVYANTGLRDACHLQRRCAMSSILQSLARCPRLSNSRCNLVCLPGASQAVQCGYIGTVLHCSRRLWLVEADRYWSAVRTAHERRFGSAGRGLDGGGPGQGGYFDPEGIVVEVEGDVSR
jgi:hypothetical protein